MIQLNGMNHPRGCSCGSCAQVQGFRRQRRAQRRRDQGRGPRVVIVGDNVSAAQVADAIWNGGLGDATNDAFAGCARAVASGRRSPLSGLAGPEDSFKRDKKGEKVQIGTAIGAGAITGASVGAVAGPIGAAVGAAVGAIAGGAVGYVGKESARKKLRKQKKQAFYQLVAEDTARREAAAKARGQLVDQVVEAARLRNMKSQNKTRGLLLAKRADLYGANDLRDEALEIAGSDPFLDDDMVEEGLRLDQARLVEIEGQIAQFSRSVAALRPSSPSAGSAAALKKQVTDKAEAIIARMAPYGERMDDLRDEVDQVLWEDVYTESDDAAEQLRGQLARLDEVISMMSRRAASGGLGGINPALGDWFAKVRQANRVRVGLPPGRVRPQGYLEGMGESRAPDLLGIALGLGLGWLVVRRLG